MSRSWLLLSDLGQALLFLACYNDITFLSADRDPHSILYLSVNSPSYHPSLGDSAPWEWGAWGALTHLLETLGYLCINGPLAEEL